MSKFTFLTEEQVWGYNQLDILKKYGTQCEITDFSILLSDNRPSYYTKKGSTRKKITNWWWTKTPYDVFVIAADYNGSRIKCYAYNRSGGARPALPYSAIKSISSNEVIDASVIKEVEYGEYPQTIVDENYSCELEKAYIKNSLKTTGKSYITSGHSIDNSFRARVHTEYEYNGRKYIRILGDFICVRGKLSDGRTIEFGKPYWVAVEPITWWVDERADIALSKKILFSGVQFSHKKYYGNFEKTDIKKYMDKYFAKDIIPSKINEIIDVEPLEETKEKIEKIEKLDKNEKEQIKTKLDTEEAKPIILSTENNSNKKTIEKTELTPKTTPDKTILKSYELEEGNYQIYRVYVGEDNYKNILVKWDIDGNVDTLRLTCIPNIANIDNNDLTTTPLKTYQKQFETTDDFAVHYNSFIEESEIEFAEDYNVVEAKALYPLLEEKYGQQTFYTVEQINNIISTKAKESKRK